MSTEPQNVTPWGRYRRKPATVRARRNLGPPYRIKTLHGEAIVATGDLEIEGPLGDHWPCKPAQFDATYEPEAIQGTV